MDFDKVEQWLDDHAEQMVDLQAELTKRPAIGPENGGKGEADKAEFLEQYLQRCGLPAAEHFDAPDKRVPEGHRPNFGVTLPGDRAARRICVMTHLDVVPPGERDDDGGWKGWDSDPFELRRQDGTIYGRGVEDNQQALVASVFALRAVVETEQGPIPPVTLLFVSDEETGSKLGLQYVLENHSDIFNSSDIILVPDGGNPEGDGIEIAEKSVLWLRFTVDGRQTHGSTPEEGVNAFRAASRMVNRLDEALHESFDEVNDLYAPPSSTFEPTLHEKNVPNVNTVPGKDIFCFDCRVLPSYDLDDVLECIKQECGSVDEEMGTNTELEVINRLDAPGPTADDAPAVRMLSAALEEVRGIDAETRGIGGSTVAAHFRRHGYPAVVWSTVNATMHQANEHCDISNMVNDSKVFARLFTWDPEEL